MTRRRQLLTELDAVKTEKQHKSPCSDCPWARTALNGWLGDLTAEEWLKVAHSEGMMECHTTDKQCAGAAIYRANVCKRVMNEEALKLPRDTDKVFATPMEFMEHHSKMLPMKKRGKK